MGINDFRRARHHEPPRARRKVRVVLRNSRSRSSSHSENDAEYIMGLRKSANSREYDIIDVRFSNSTAAMAQKLRQMAEEHKSRITANEDVKALTESVAEGMRIKVEEELLQRLDMIPEEPKDSHDTVPLNFGAEESSVWILQDDATLRQSSAWVLQDDMALVNGRHNTAPTHPGDAMRHNPQQNYTGLDWDELVPEEPSSSFDIETDDIYGLMSDLLNSPGSSAAVEKPSESTFVPYCSPMKHTHFSLLNGTAAYVPPLPQITSAAQLRMQRKEESFARMFKPNAVLPETFDELGEAQAGFRSSWSTLPY